MIDRAQLRDRMAAAALARQQTQELPAGGTPAGPAETMGLESRQGTGTEQIHTLADHDRGNVPGCSGTQRVTGTHHQQHSSQSGEDQHKQGLPGSLDAGAKLQEQANALQDVNCPTNSSASAAARAPASPKSARPYSRQRQINSQDKGHPVIDLSDSPFPANQGHEQRSPQRHEGHKARQAGIPGAWMPKSKWQKNAAVDPQLCDDDKPASGILDLTDEHESGGLDGIEHKDLAVTSVNDNRICCPVCLGIWPEGSLSNAELNAHLDQCLSSCC